MPKYVDETGLTRFYDNIADRPVYTFDTVAEMQAATYLEDGMTCHTNGFHEAGDGGAAYYMVSTNGTADDMNVLALQGGLFATKVNISLSNAAIDEITDGDVPSSDGFLDETGLTHLWDNIKKNTLKQITLTSISEITAYEPIDAIFSVQQETAARITLSGFQYEGEYIFTDDSYIRNTANVTDLDVTDATDRESIQSTLLISGAENVTFTNLRIVNENVNNIFNGIMVDAQSSGVAFIDCVVDGFRWIGLGAYSPIRVIGGQYVNNNYGIWANTDNCIIDGAYVSNHFSDLGKSWDSTDLYYDGITLTGDNCQVTNCIIVDNGQSGIYASDISGCTFSNNVVRDNFNKGIDLGGLTSGTNTIINCVITGNTVIDNKTGGVNLTNAENIVVSSNLVIDSDGASCIILEGVTTKCVINSNVLASSYRGVSLGNSVTEVTALNNQIAGGITSTISPYDQSIRVARNIYSDYGSGAVIRQKVVVDLDDGTYPSILLQKPSNLYRITIASDGVVEFLDTNYAPQTVFAKIVLSGNVAGTAGSIGYNSTNGKLYYYDGVNRISHEIAVVN